MSKKRDIYNEMDSEENDTYAEGYPSYYEEEDVGEPENMDNSSEQMQGGYLDEEAEEDPYYDEEGGEAYEPYFDPYDPRFQQYLLKNGYIKQGGGGSRREDNYDYEDFDFSSPSASSSSSSSSESSDSSSEESSDSSSDEKVTKRKPKRTFRARKKATHPKKNSKKTTKKRKSK